MASDGHNLRSLGQEASNEPGTSQGGTHPTVDDLKKRIARYVDALAESGENFLHPENISKEVRDGYVESLSALFSQELERLTTEIIGEDEALFGSTINQQLIDAQNQLRAEQRERRNTALGKPKEDI